MAANGLVDLARPRPRCGPASSSAASAGWSRAAHSPVGRPVRGEVAPVLGLDAVDQQRLGAGQRRRPGRPRRRVHATARRSPTGRPAAVDADCITRCACHSSVSTVSSRMAWTRSCASSPVSCSRAGRGTVSSVSRRLVEPLAVLESIRTGGDLGGDLGALIGVRGLDLLDLLLRRAVLGLEQQVERLDHRRLADLVGAADHDHAAVGKLDRRGGRFRDSSSGPADAASRHAPSSGKPQQQRERRAGVVGLVAVRRAPWPPARRRRRPRSRRCRGRRTRRRRE